MQRRAAMMLSTQPYLVPNLRTQGGVPPLPHTPLLCSAWLDTRIASVLVLFVCHFFTPPFPIGPSDSPAVFERFLSMKPTSNHT